MNRQGDLLIKTISALPDGVKVIKTNILLEGEATGHAHRINGGEVFSDKAGKLYFRVKQSASLDHEEHKSIKFKKGIYEVVRQREYVNADMAKVVVD